MGQFLSVLEKSQPRPPVQIRNEPSAQSGHIAMPLVVDHFGEFGAEGLTERGQKPVRNRTRELARTDTYPPGKDQKAPHDGEVEGYPKDRCELVQSRQCPFESNARSRAMLNRFIQVRCWFKSRVQSSRVRVRLGL